MAKTTKAVVRPKRSRAEIEEEFTEIREEATTTREMLEPKAEDLRKQREGVEAARLTPNGASAMTHICRLSGNSPTRPAWPGADAALRDRFGEQPCRQLRGVLRLKSL